MLTSRALGTSLDRMFALNRADAMYGKDGTEYRTEADIFARIVARVSAANASLGEINVVGSVGGLAVTSLAFVAAVLGGFYEVDNTPDDAAKAEGGARVAEGAGKSRIAASATDEDEDLEDSAPAQQTNQQTKKR